MINYQFFPRSRGVTPEIGENNAIDKSFYADALSAESCTSATDSEATQ